MMSKLEVFDGTLEECQARINKLEETQFVFVVNARSIMEEETQFGSGTGFIPPKVMQWQIMLQLFPVEDVPGLELHDVGK